MSKDFECDPVLESSVPCKIRRKLKCSMVPSIFPHNAHDEELQAELLKRRRIELVSCALMAAAERPPIYFRDQ